MSLRVRSCDSKEVEHLLQQCSPARESVFKEPWWWEAVSFAAGIDYDVLVIAGESEDLALMPLFKQSLPLIRRVGAPLRGTFTATMGLRLLKADPEVSKAGMRAVANYARQKMGANWLEFGYAVDEDVAALGVHDANVWRREEKNTFVVDLAVEEDAAWNAIESRARNMVRKAEKNGVRVVRLKGDSGDVEDFYAMLKGTFAKSGRIPPHSKHFYTCLIQRLMKGGHLLFLGAEFEGELVAFGLFPYNDYEIQYLSGTSSAAGNTSAANSLIQWEAIRFAVEHGIRRYDLGGGGIASIDKFKMSFGGRPESYTRYTWMAPWLRGTLSAYLKVRPMLDRLRAGLDRRAS